MFFYVYVLYSKKDNQYYTGYTSNLHKRIEEHKNKATRSTTHRQPLILIYYEASGNKQDARAREKYLKSSPGKKFLSRRLYYQRHNDHESLL